MTCDPCFPQPSSRRRFRPVHTAPCACATHVARLAKISSLVAQGQREHSGLSFSCGLLHRFFQKEITAKIFDSFFCFFLRNKYFFYTVLQISFAISFFPDFVPNNLTNCRADYNIVYISLSLKYLFEIARTRKTKVIPTRAAMWRICGGVAGVAPRAPGVTRQTPSRPTSSCPPCSTLSSYPARRDESRLQPLLRTCAVVHDDVPVQREPRWRAVDLIVFSLARACCQRKSFAARGSTTDRAGISAKRAAVAAVRKRADTALPRSSSTTRSLERKACRLGLGRASASQWGPGWPLTPPRLRAPPQRWPWGWRHR